MVPEARVYRGFTPSEWRGAYARTLTQFEEHIGSEFSSGISIDKIMERQLRKDTTGKIVVVDFGAGDGNFTKEFLTDTSVGKRTRGLLRGASKRDTTIDFLGINDSPHPYQHLHDRVILPDREDPLKDRIRGTEVSYSVTSSQTMSKLFEAKGIEGVDLVVASNSVSYLSPPVFRGFTMDVIESLKPGGQCLVYGYGEITGDRYCIDEGYEVFDSDDVDFVLNRKKVSSSAVKEVGRNLESSPLVRDEVISTYILNTFESAYATGAFYPEDEAEVRKGIDEGLRIMGPRVMLSNFLNSAFAELEGVVRIKEEKDKKDSILYTLAEQYKDKIAIDKGRRAFWIHDIRK